MIGFVIPLLDIAAPLLAAVKSPLVVFHRLLGVVDSLIALFDVEDRMPDLFFPLPAVLASLLHVFDQPLFVFEPLPDAVDSLIVVFDSLPDAEDLVPESVDQPFDTVDSLSGDFPSLLDVFNSLIIFTDTTISSKCRHNS